jgi:hypothetical protein
MSNLRYHSVQPENQQILYQEMNNVDFNISLQGRKIVGGSVRLVGDIALVYAAGAEPLDVDVAYDHMVGSHCFIDRIDTSSSVKGVIENLSDYPRYVATKTNATLFSDDLNNSNYVCENRCGSDNIANQLLKGMVDVDKSGEATRQAGTKDLDFSLRLDFCLNNVVSQDIYVPYVKTGDIRISLTLARNVYVLFGDDTIGGSTYYTLKNLKLMFCSIPDNGVYAPVYQMRVKTSLKQSLQSSFANISTKVPMVCDAFFASVVQQSNENAVSYNGMELQRPPNIQSLEYIWSDSLSQEYRYQLLSEEEILHNFMKSVSLVAGTSNMNSNALNSNKGWGLGLAFGMFVDLSVSKIGINLKSDISSGNPYVLYMFFSGLTQF